MIKDGIININKPEGMTSHDVIYKLRKIIGVKKMGHTGTLDPMATGVLPICLGKATRVAEYMDVDFKKYRCTMILGVITDTQDVTGEVLETFSTDGVTEEDVRAAFSGFHGVIDQKPPMYSAVRVGGRRLYDYARAGEEVEVKTRQIYIRSLEIEHIDLNPEDSKKRVTFSVECSKGTYIRTICQDAGQALGCGATMEKLERTSSGCFKIEEAYTLDQLREVGEKAGLDPSRRFGEEVPEVFEEYVLGVDYPLWAFGEVVLSPELGEKFIDGWHISYKECTVTKEAEYREKEPEFRIRPEYKRAYKIYAEDPKAPGEREFLGVAFHSDKYKKLVADKVFARSEKNGSI
ncbi:MAG: tRNA pseudouridine(55) synthase TruB [Firmicutes bacterium]|nr:tRNA pseudouridine(55) synthase TruB [Bacillota bacterium]